MDNDVIISDSGPIIHLDEVEANFAWNIFSKVHIPECVKDEVTVTDKPGSKTIYGNIFSICSMNKENRELSENLMKEYQMTQNDSLVLSMAILMHADMILTDDLDLREISKKVDILPVGTIGILLRAFRKGFCSIKQLYSILDRLYKESSLYITDDLIVMVKYRARDFSKGQ